MTDALPELAIVVVNSGSSPLLEEHLAAIDRTALPPLMVVVVDNRTTDGERRLLRPSRRSMGGFGPPPTRTWASAVA